MGIENKQYSTVVYSEKQFERTVIKHMPRRCSLAFLLADDYTYFFNDEEFSRINTRGYISIEGENVYHFVRGTPSIGKFKITQCVTRLVFNVLINHTILVLNLDRNYNSYAVVPNEYIKWLTKFKELAHLWEDKTIVEGEEHLDFIKTKRARVDISKGYEAWLNKCIETSLTHDVLVVDYPEYFELAGECFNAVYCTSLSSESAFTKTLEVLNPASVLEFDGKFFTKSFEEGVDTGVEFSSKEEALAYANIMAV